MSWLQGLEEVRHQAGTLGNVVRALELLCALRQQYADDVEIPFHLREVFSWLVRRIQPHHDPRGLKRRPWLFPAWAEAIDDRAGQRPQAEIGVCPGVLIDLDRSGDGFIVEFVVEDAGGLAEVFPASFGFEFRRALRMAQAVSTRILLAAAALDLSRTYRRGERYLLRGPRAATSFVTEGGSLGAAAAVAMASQWCGLAVPHGIVVVGAVGEQGEIRAVDRAEVKIATVLRERPTVKKVLIAEGGPGHSGDGRVVRVGNVEQLFEAVFGAECLQRSAHQRVDVEGAVRRGVELYEKHNSFEAAATMMTTALDAIAVQRGADASRFRQEEFTALWRRGSSLIHLGKVGDASEVFHRADALGARLWNEQVLGPEAYLGYRGNRAVLLRDTFQYEAAESSLRETLALQQRLRQDKRAQAKILGNLGELLSFVDRFDEAQSVLDQALDLLRLSYPEEVPRAHCNLGNLFLRQRDARQALVCYQRGLEANRDIEYGHRQNEAFLRYGEARAELALGRAAAAERAATIGLTHCAADSSYPRQLLLACQGLSAVRQQRLDRAQPLLLRAAALTFVEGDLLRFGLSTALGHLAIALFDDGQACDDSTAEMILRLTDTAQAVPGLTDAGRLDVELRDLLSRRPVSPSAITERLEELLRWFPYGIDPWVWREGADASGRAT